jgi:hypothetical protein
LVLKPPQDVGKVVVQGTGQAVGETHCGAHQTPAMCDEVRQGAQGGALGAQWGERVAVFEAALDLACGLGGGVFRPARGKRVAILGDGERMDGKAHEALLVTQRRHDGAFMECQAYSDGWSMEARAEGVAPGVTFFRAMCKAQQRTVCSASGLEADIVFRLSPVEAKKSRQCFGCWLLHG